MLIDIFSPVCVHMPGNNRSSLVPGANCCDNQPCRRTYADYGTYLKKRRCVGPSDLCTFQRNVQEGKIPVGCISHSGDSVLIEPCNLVVNSNQFIEMSAGSSACRPAPPPGDHIVMSTSGSIEETADTFVDIRAGCDPPCEPASSGDISLSAKNAIRAVGRAGGVIISAGAGHHQGACSPCDGDSKAGPGKLVLGAKTSAELSSEGDIHILAGCCTGASGSVEICGPQGIEIHSIEGPVQLSGADGVSIEGGAGPVAIDTSSYIGLSGGAGISMDGGSGPVTIDTSSQIELFGGSGISMDGGSGPVAIDTSSHIGLSGGAGISMDGGAGPVAIDTSSQIELFGGSGISMDGRSGRVAIDTSSQIELFGGSGISIGGGSGPVAIGTSSHIGLSGGVGISMDGGSGPVAIDTSSQIELFGGSGISVGGGSGPIAMDTSSHIGLSGGVGISISGGSGPLAIDTSSHIGLSGGAGISMDGGSGPLELSTNSHISMSGASGIAVHSEGEIALSTAMSHGPAISVSAGPSAYVQVGAPLYARPQTVSQPPIVRHVHSPVASKHPPALLTLDDLTSGLISVSTSSGSHHLTLPPRNQLWNGITVGDAIDFSIHLEHTGPSGLSATTLSLTGAHNYYPSPGLTDVIATHDVSNIGRFTLRDNGSGLDLIRIG